MFFPREKGDFIPFMKFENLSERWKIILSLTRGKSFSILEATERNNEYLEVDNSISLLAQ